MIKKVTRVCYRCVCDLPDCPGKGRPWFSQDEEIPKRCSWCKRYTWNGPDKRFTLASESPSVVDNQSSRPTKTGPQPKAIKAKAKRRAAVSIPLPKPKKVRSLE